MSRYSIEGSTLTAIGDAIRDKTGKLTRTETQIIEIEAPSMEIVKSSNATGLESYEGNFNPGVNDIYTPITLTGATSIKVKLGYGSPGYNYYVAIVPGAYTAETWPGIGSATRYYGAKNIVELTFENTDSITIFWHQGSSTPINGYYYAECYPLDADGNIPTETVEKEVEVEVANTLTPSQMVTEISTIELGETLPEEALTITGNCNYRFSNNGWNWYIDLFKDKLTTEDISGCSFMFSNSDSQKFTSIPFDINPDNSMMQFQYMFQNCSSLTTLPRIHWENITYVSSSELSLNNMFDGCYRLREIPYDFFTKNNPALWENKKNLNNKFQQIFNNCYSLRQHPDINCLRFKITASYTYSYALYNTLFQGSASLDEVTNIPVCDISATTSNCFSRAFADCYRLKTILFETNEDGSPIVASAWKNQTIDLSAGNTSYGIGYASAGKRSNITGYNSGITTDKEVNSDATYQALKNDDDWYGIGMNYSRYNHDSAVATINSLPDVSAGSGNTIKFRGAVGAKTDGGAINTLTEEEIAVATAKGWTVSLV